MAEWFNRSVLGLIRKLLDESPTDEQRFQSCCTTTVECPIPFSALPVVTMYGWQPRNVVIISINMSDAEECQDEHGTKQMHRHPGSARDGDGTETPIVFSCSSRINNKSKHLHSKVTSW